MSTALQSILLLIGSNIFMVVAWYGHLKFAPTSTPLFFVIAGAWLIALPEYILQVPANRLGSHYFGGPFSTAQLKIIAEAINLLLFTIFTLVVLKDKMRPTDYIAFGLVMAAVIVSASGGRFDKAKSASSTPATTGGGVVPAETPSEGE